MTILTIDFLEWAWMLDGHQWDYKPPDPSIVNELLWL